MKKIIFLSLFMIGLFALDQIVSAQAVPATGTWVNNIGRAKTTSTNADTAICQIALPGFYNVLNFEVAVTKVTGTAAGKVYLFGNLNGANPLTQGQFNSKNPDIIDSLTLSDLTVNKKQFQITTSKCYYYWVIYKPSGTQTSTFVVKYIARKEFGQ